MLESPTLLPRPPRPVDAVVTHLRESILDGDPAPGATLPAERELAERLGVSRLTLRAALARLEAEGLVRARQGDGVRVLDPKEHAGLAVLAHLDLTRRPELVRAFLELRRAVAAEAIAAACQRMDTAAIDALVHIVDAQRAESDDARYAERDLAFSRALLAGAGNFAMILLLNTVDAVHRAHPEITRAIHADRALSIAGYELVLSLLRGRDPALARDALRAALEHADALTLERLAARRTRGAKRPSRKISK